MKKRYEKPELSVKEYASFENVFAYCTKGNPTKPECIVLPGVWNPGDDPKHAAYSGATGS